MTTDHTTAPRPARTGTTPAGTEYHAYDRHDAADAARWAPDGLALATAQIDDEWVAAWVGVEGADESPRCHGPTEADAVAALFGEGDDEFESREVELAERRAGWSTTP